MAREDLRFKKFAPFVQKVLDIVVLLLYNRRRQVPGLKNLCTITAKESLTSRAFARILPGWGGVQQRPVASQKILRNRAKKT